MKDISRLLESKKEFFASKIDEATQKNNRIDVRYFNRCLKRVIEMEKLL